MSCFRSAISISHCLDEKPFFITGPHQVTVGWRRRFLSPSSLSCPWGMSGNWGPSVLLWLKICDADSVGTWMFYFAWLTRNWGDEQNGHADSVGSNYLWQQFDSEVFSHVPSHFHGKTHLGRLDRDGQLCTVRGAQHDVEHGGLTHGELHSQLAGVGNPGIIVFNKKDNLLRWTQKYLHFKGKVHKKYKQGSKGYFSKVVIKYEVFSWKTQSHLFCSWNPTQLQFFGTKTSHICKNLYILPILLIHLKN